MKNGSTAAGILFVWRVAAPPTPRAIPGAFDPGRVGVKGPWYQVPVLVDGETRIFDSTIILEYIEERWPDPPLLPRSPEARAAARMTEDVCDTQYEAVTWGYGEVMTFGRAGGALAETLRPAAARQTSVLQDWLSGRLGGAAWFGGAVFGWADAAVAPLLHRSVLNGMGPAAGSSLEAWYRRLLERPSVIATFAEYAAGAARMPATVVAFRSGAKVREYRDHRLEWMIRSGGIEVVLAGLRDGTIRFTWPHG